MARNVMLTIQNFRENKLLSEHCFITLLLQLATKRCIKILRFWNSDMLLYDADETRPFFSLHNSSLLHREKTKQENLLRVRRNFTDTNAKYSESQTNKRTSTSS